MSRPYTPIPPLHLLHQRRISSDGGTKHGARNPVSQRLYKILGTDYDDTATRDALRVLSELYHADDVNLKSNDVQSASLGIIENQSLGNITPSLHSSTAARARKSLRRDVEIRATQDSREFLQVFKQVNNELDDLHKHVESMHARCDEAEHQLQSTNEACKSLLERAGGLRSLQQAVNNRHLVLNAFLSYFMLTMEEIQTIQSGEEAVGRKFFLVLRRTERVREDCRVLMLGEEGPTKAGSELVSFMSQLLEEGYTKISRWCSLEFRQLGRHTQLDVSPVMREAMHWLQKRSELVSEVLAVLAQTRQAAVFSAFMSALTRGGPHGLPRPIEIHAHDPMRYVGDMLAWIHQAVAEEREFLDALFDVQGDDRMVGSVRRFQRSETEEWIQNLMDRAFEKLCSPLKVRIRQTIRAQESCITSYKVVNLLQFYTLTMLRTIGDNAVLSQALAEITKGAYETFSDMIDAQARNVSRTTLPDDLDLQPPLVLLDHIQILRELMAVYDSSLLGDESDEERRSGFGAILNRMVAAALDMCRAASDAKQLQKPSWDRDIFMLNSITHIQNALLPYAFTDTKSKELEDLIDNQVAMLSEDHYRNILSETHLDRCAIVCEMKPHDGPISRIGAMQPAELRTALDDFAQWLSSPDVVRSHRLSALIDQRLSQKIHLSALRRLAGAYQSLCTEVKKPENKYEAANTILGSQRPFGQTTVLLQILGIEAEDVGE